MAALGTDVELELLARLRGDFAIYASRCLTIRGKSGLGKFTLNRAQRYVHARLQAQLAETGRVRALILKGRQQGMSSYVQGRFYWRVTGGFGKRAFILTHEDQATQNLFEMATRYHENMPGELKPSTKRASATELYFDLLDSGYRVGTARTKGVGRSGTVQYLHGSEIAHWPNQREHMAGVMQSIPSGAAADGTEIILETTANSIGEMFHDMWTAAERGIGEYVPIFVPWYWQEEYRTAIPDGFELTEEEEACRDAYELDLEQIVWRRNKIETEFRGALWLWRQEYPAYPAEAFQTPTNNPLIDPNRILAARARIAPAYGPKVLGVDVARQGKDRSAAVLRQGRKVHFGAAKHDPDLMSVAGWVGQLIETHNPDAVFIDGTGGYGAAVIDRLRERNFKVNEVQFGGRAIKRDRYHDKRSEMWGEMKEWMEDAVQIPDQDDLHSDLATPESSQDSSSRLRLESKESMAKRGLRSPDKGDALALTFAGPVCVAKSSVISNRQPYRAASTAGY